MQLPYKCSDTCCSGFMLRSHASLLQGAGRKAGVETQDASMALFGFWALFGVVSFLLSPSQYKEISAVRCRYLDIA